MPDTGRQIWEKIRVSRDAELTPLENKNEQEQNKNVKKWTKRKIEKQRKMNEKKIWMKGQWKMVPHKKDHWSDHPKTRIEPTYPFY